MILKIDDRIRARQVEFWNSFDLTLSYDSVASTFNFDYYFNPDNQEHVELACLGHYHIATVEHNGELLITGNVINETFPSSPKKELVKFSGYSLPGILEDCQIPIEAYPIQFDGLNLREISNKILPYFKLKSKIDPSVSSRMGQAYEKTDASPSQSVKEFLTKLAAQKNIVITHDEKGNVVFTSAKTQQNPVVAFGEGGLPFTKMQLVYNGQGMHSHITVLREASEKGGNAGQSTIRNPYVPFIYRPKTIIQSSGTDNDTSLVAKTARAEELKGIKLIIETDRWEVNGKVIKPNNIVLVKNKDLYLFKSTKWFIESVRLTGDNVKTVATLTCVLPEVYNMQEPKYLFEGVNLH